MKTAHDLVEAARAEIREIPLDQAEDAIKEADVLLDVREADEYHTSHIPGAVNVSRGILEFKLTNDPAFERSEEHTSELQSRPHLVCRLLLEKKKFQLLFKKSTCRSSHDD